MIRSWIAAARAAACELGVGCLRLGVEQVVADGGMEEVRLLRDHPDRVGERGRAEVADVVAVELDAPRVTSYSRGIR